MLSMECDWPYTLNKSIKDPNLLSENNDFNQSVTIE